LSFEKAKASWKALKASGFRRTLHAVYVRKERLRRGIVPSPSPIWESSKQTVGHALGKARKGRKNPGVSKMMKKINARAKEIYEKGPKGFDRWHDCTRQAIRELKGGSSPSSSIPEPVKQVVPKLIKGGKVTSTKFPDFPDLTPQSVVRLKELCARAVYNTPITYSTAEAYLSLESPMRWTEKLWEKFKADFMFRERAIVGYFQLNGKFIVEDNRIVFRGRGR
jgi:hypothetical protein